MNKDYFYITTPIYYVTAKPHLGSLYSTLLADVIARWEWLKGQKTFFLTGTDEHGQKIAQAAQKANQDPQAFVDSFIPAYQDVWRMYEIDYSSFIRTTSSEHKRGVLFAVNKLLENGSIYKSTYQGWYCVSDETFVTEKTKTDQTEQAPRCPSCFRETTFLAEETYFFKLSSFQERLLTFYKEHPDFIVPKERMNEILSFVTSGLNDLSISRTTVSWGIPFPQDPSHVIYVWVDALLNYLTGIGYGINHTLGYTHYWPADLQVLGKDIIRFHAVYWPALLMALELPLPKRLLVHGWIKVNNQKMSKSFGNVVDPVDLYHVYGPEPVRYYLMRQLAINQDGEFNDQDLEQRINADLANDLGNLLQRMVSLALKYQCVHLKAPKLWSANALELQEQATLMINQVIDSMNDYSIHMALTHIWEFIHKVNSYFHTQEPWKLVSKNKEHFEEILSATAHSLHIIGTLLLPIMPRKMEELFDSLGIKKYDPESVESPLERISTDIWQDEFRFKVSAPLFEKIMPKKDEQPMEEKKQDTKPTISIDQFAAVELSVGTIEAVESIAGSEKLLKLQVNFGPLGKRQILSGIKQFIKPETILHKQAVFVTNLATRTMLGYESQGMLLTARDEQGKLHTITPTEAVPNGTRLQ